MRSRSETRQPGRVRSHRAAPGRGDAGHPRRRGAWQRDPHCLASLGIACAHPASVWVSTRQFQKHHLRMAGPCRILSDTSALATLDRSVTQLQQDGLAEIFDQQAVQERMEMGQVAGDILGTYYDNRIAEYEAQIDDLLVQADAASAAGDMELSSQLRQQVATLRQQRDDGKLPQTLAHMGVGLGLSVLTGSNTLTGN